MRSRWLAFVCSPLIGALLSCGGSDSPSTPASPTPGAAPTLTILGMAFSPLSLQVAPGAVVTVHNLDSMPHTVTSESAPGVFKPGAVAGVSFDTGPFHTTGTFGIPANAPVGTVIPYYCMLHLGTMATPDGEIRVVATPTAAATPAPTSP